MSEAVSAVPPLSAPQSRTQARIGRFGPLLFGSVACVLMLASNLLWRESYTGDEGFYGVTAQNMLRAPEYWLRPSYLPAGDFAADRGGFAHPPVSSFFYAASLWLAGGSLAGPEILHALAFAGLLFLAYRLLALYDLQSARIAVLLLAASPAMAAAYSLQESEPLMATCGLAAVYGVLRGGFRDEHHGWLFVGGLGLGLAFALKLWLVGPIALAVGVALLVVGWRSAGPLRATTRGLAWFLAGAALPSALHLAAIAVFFPRDLTFWLHDIYLGIFTQSGISGSKLDGSAAPAGWAHPVWYYAAALYREHYFLVPLLLFGTGALMRDTRLRSSLLLIVAAGIAGIVPLSLLRVKEPLYILPSVVFLHLLAACCIAAIQRRLECGADLDRFSRQLGTGVTALLLVGVAFAWSRGLKADDVTRGFVLMHTLTFGFVLAALAWARRPCARAGEERLLYAACGIALATAFAHTALTRQPRDETIARVVRPAIESNAPATLSMVASNFKGYQNYLYRRGVYWHELNLAAEPAAVLESAPFATVRVFIVDPVDQQRPEIAPWLRWLEAHATERTGEVNARLGRPAGYRVFVRET